MKFLIITRQKDSFVMLPPEMQRQLMEGQAAFIDKYRKAGKIQVIYNMPGLKGGIAMFEVESGEEGDRILLEYPMYPFVDVEMYALSDYDAHARALKEAYQRWLAKK